MYAPSNSQIDLPLLPKVSETHVSDMIVALFGSTVWGMFRKHSFYRTTIRRCEGARGLIKRWPKLFSDSVSAMMALSIQDNVFHIK